ncbi:hypothetical protein [Paracoccus laeviglucosivorans]|uniref:Uncharacterized protein n=1 Tax=Paracoccus laeviglucosivorans TaxID=1197861 RepID=A0A521E5F9_9RHOB|nr:hypothetical protein [Paracoccus laeviglucosivorans]SMO79173.1 hypothetical protein SAMN06265221_11168 [Paracoccus laeviglucosivorans]
MTRLVLTPAMQVSPPVFSRGELRGIELLAKSTGVNANDLSSVLATSQNCARRRNSVAQTIDFAIRLEEMEEADRRERKALLACASAILLAAIVVWTVL